MNCLNSSVSSFSTAVMTRFRALSCSMRAFCLSEFLRRSGTPCRRPRGRDVLGDQLVDAVGVGPRDVAELVVEGLEDVREPIELGLGLVRRRGRAPGSISASASGSWIFMAACFSTR
jgi:hypothetical protein